MGDVVNLKRFKKRTEREQSAKQADANRALSAAPNPNASLTSSAANAPATCWISTGIDGGDAS